MPTLTDTTAYMNGDYITLPYIDPVLISFGGSIGIRWYALAYILGLLIGWLYARKLVTSSRLWVKSTMTPLQIDDLLIWMTLGVVLGGRLGAVLLYPHDRAFYFDNPWEIPKVWHGGMAFHGGLAGAALAVIIFAWRNRISILSALDVVSAVAPIGLFLGRIANFINDELWGRAAWGVPWGVISPSSPLTEEGLAVPRHPSQLYEALGEGLLLFLLLLILIRLGALKRPGLTAGVFGAGYALARSVCELYREPDGMVLGNLITIGQAYSLPMIAIGLALCISAMMKKPIQA